MDTARCRPEMRSRVGISSVLCTGSVYPTMGGFVYLNSNIYGTPIVYSSSEKVANCPYAVHRASRGNIERIEHQEFVEMAI